MIRQCAVCGVEFSAQRPQAKYCGQTCRKRRQRSPERVKTAELSPKLAESLGSAQVSAPSGGLLSTVERELRSAGRLETVSGQQAMLLAQRMCDFDSISGMAALSKELRAVMVDALATAGELDPVDELKKRRDAKRDAG